MCARYRPSGADVVRQFSAPWRGEPPAQLLDEAFPGLRAPFVRRPPERASGDEAVPARESVVGVFGLLPHWARDEKLARSTYNARSETVTAKPAFRDAWRRAQHCIVPADAFYEPDWRSGRHVPTRISRADGKPLGIAGLWSWWRPPGGEAVHSFTMLTINADAHPVMCRYHRPGEEKRMIVLLDEADYDAWLDAPPEHSMEFMRQCPPERLVAVPEGGSA